jgi:hypothetical protein
MKFPDTENITFCDLGEEPTFEESGLDEYLTYLNNEATVSLKGKFPESLFYVDPRQGTTQITDFKQNIIEILTNYSNLTNKVKKCRTIIDSPNQHQDMPCASKEATFNNK